MKNDNKTANPSETPEESLITYILKARDEWLKERENAE